MQKLESLEKTLMFEKTEDSWDQHLIDFIIGGWTGINLQYENS